MSPTSWDRFYSNLNNAAWADMPSPFAILAQEYFTPAGRILELGAGTGRDGRFFARQGLAVISTDQSEAALKLSTEMTTDDLRTRMTYLRLDMGRGFPFKEQEFDAVYSHLSVHYFSLQTTTDIIAETNRVLRKGGIFAFVANSTSDPEYRSGREIEEDFFQIGQGTKRYLSVESASRLVSCFEVLLLDALGEDSFTDRHQKHNLIRFIGRKC